MNETIKTFLARRGQVCTVSWERPCKVRSAFKDTQVTKEVTMQCRAGVTYDNISRVQDKREAGELPAENQGLPWGKWFIFPHVIEHNGAFYLRFSYFPSNVPSKVTYRIQGQEVAKDEALKLCLASESQERGELDVFNVKSDYIKSIN